MGDGDGGGQLDLICDRIRQPGADVLLGQSARRLDLLAVNLEVAAESLRIAAQHQG